MPKFSVNYASLDNSINKRAYKLSEVKDRIEKVAFDVVRFKDADKGAELWQIQSSDDGEYIVSLYSEEESGLNKVASRKTDWEVVNRKGNLHFFYKGEPITKIASSNLGIEESDAALMESYLPVRLAEEKTLVSLLLKQLDVGSKKIILAKYPELAA